MIVIVDCNIGNLLSIKKMLLKAGAKNVKISSHYDDILNASKLILPGVGHFDYGMDQLRKSELIKFLEEKVLNQKTPILGICLGAQLMTKSSEEGKTSGLSWIDANTVKFKLNKTSNLKVPNMGWLDVDVVNKSPLFESIEENSRFYFVHTYHIECNIQSDIAVRASYGYDFTAGFIKDNIMGMQFHPEKSHRFGLEFMRNFIKNY